MAGRSRRLHNIERRRRPRSDGTVAETFRVRWVDEDGARQRETFDTLDEAVAFRDELESRVAMLRGGPAERARTTVADGYARWWTEHVVPTLEQRTRDGYARVWERHLAERVGPMLLIDLTTAELERLKDGMLADGVGPATVRKAIALLGSMLGHAARRGYVEHNAALAVRKPSARPRRRRRMPPSIEVVERIREAALDDLDSPLTSIWVSIGAYAGLRPGEIRALRWQDVGERTIAITDAVGVDGSRRGHTKTYQDRAAELLPVLADDLRAWRALTPYPQDGDPIAPAASGRPICDEGYKNFVRRKFASAAAAAEWPCAPYDLRHFNASLLIKEGRLSLQEIAGHLGHTLVELSRTYAREITEYRGRQIDIAAEIARVRAGPFSEDVACTPTGGPPAFNPEVGSSDLVAKLVDLNVAGILSDGELAAKLRTVMAA